MGLVHELRPDVETLAGGAADRRARQHVHASPARRRGRRALGAGTGRRTVLFHRGLPVEVGPASCPRRAADSRIGLHQVAVGNELARNTALAESLLPPQTSVKAMLVSRCPTGVPREVAGTVGIMSARISPYST
jgi:hypothetical protein